MPTWLITGCSTGLGRALAKAVLERGWNAVVTARTLDTIADIVAGYPDTALGCALDLIDPASIQRTEQQSRERFGTIDVLVNNAGYGYRAAVEEADQADIEQLFATNVFGTVAVLKAFLPAMRARRRGAIVNVTSVAGRMAAPGSGYYSATKFAMEGLSDALRKELDPLGIRVMLVEPGAFRTDFAGRSLQQSNSIIDDYANTAGLRRKEKIAPIGSEPGDPARAAQAIIETVSGATAPFRLTLGSDAFERTREELNDQLAELEAWEHVSKSTDFS